MKVAVLNGPNLGRLGTRQVDVYGLTSYADLVKLCETTGKELGLAVAVRQTDDEAELLRWLHAAADEGAAVVLNAGAWSHYSYALRDACALLRAPLIEVHISNIYAREEFRRHSVISAVATGVISGLGVDGYRVALTHLARIAVERGQTDGNGRPRMEIEPPTEIITRRPPALPGQDRTP